MLTVKLVPQRLCICLACPLLLSHPLYFLLVPCLFLSDPLLWGHANCHVVCIPVERHMWQGTDVLVHNVDLRPVNIHTKKLAAVWVNLETNPSPHPTPSSFEMTATDTLLQPVRDPESETPSWVLPGFLSHRNCKIINCYFKLLNFGSIDNYYRHSCVF